MGEDLFIIPQNQTLLTRKNLLGHRPERGSIARNEPTKISGTPDALLIKPRPIYSTSFGVKNAGRYFNFSDRNHLETITFHPLFKFHFQNMVSASLLPPSFR